MCAATFEHERLLLADGDFESRVSAHIDGAERFDLALLGVRRSLRRSRLAAGGQQDHGRQQRADRSSGLDAHTMLQRFEWGGYCAFEHGCVRDHR